MPCDGVWPKVYLITLNWNHCHETLAFLESANRLTYPNYKIIVIDNGSEDHSAVTIAAEFPGVELICNPTNLGFAAGANQGLRRAVATGAEWYFVVNNDTRLAPDVLNLLLEAALSLDADLAAPKILYASEPECIWSLGGRRNPITLEITDFRFDRSRGSIQTAPFWSDFSTACAILLRRRCLEQVGLFDERFFMYYEDADYCLRMIRAGLRILIVPQAQVWHRGAASSGGQDSPAERFHMARSSLLYFRKHVRGWQWLIVAPYRLGSALKTTARLLAAGKAAAARAFWQGLRAGLRP